MPLSSARITNGVETECRDGREADLKADGANVRQGPGSTFHNLSYPNPISAEQVEHRPDDRNDRHQAHCEHRQNRDEQQREAGPSAEGCRQQGRLSQYLSEAVQRTSIA